MQDPQGGGGPVSNPPAKSVSGSTDALVHILNTDGSRPRPSKSVPLLGPARICIWLQMYEFSVTISLGRNPVEEPPIKMSLTGCSNLGWRRIHSRSSVDTN